MTGPLSPGSDFVQSLTAQILLVTHDPVFPIPDCLILCLSKLEATLDHARWQCC